jgi:tRNA(Ile)-lysidine synthase
MDSNAESLLQTLQQFLKQLRQRRPACSKLAIGFSGGMDSHVLLHAIHQVLQLTADNAEQNPRLHRFELRVLHINHGLSPYADAWQGHCEQTSLTLNVPFLAQSVIIQCKPGESLEEQARQARYKIFAEQLQPEECLLMAHHQDDQAETLMLRLMRGAGPRGLAAMPLSRPLGKGLLWRPLLEIPRTGLQNYASACQLQWIEDESNLDVRFDRNFVRHELFPLIAKRWPGYRQSWQRSSQLSAEADQLNQELACIDYQLVMSDRKQQLNCNALCTLSGARQRNVIRYWLSLLGFPDPGWQVLRRCSDELLRAAVDAQPELIWDGHEMRRFQNRIYAFPSMPLLDKTQTLMLTVKDLSCVEKIDLPDNGLLMFSHTLSTTDSKLLKLPDKGSLVISYRRGGEHCRLSGRRTRALKKILHDAGVPPWLRDRLPLLCYENQIVYIPGAGVCDGFAAPPGTAGVRLEWLLTVDSTLS